MMGRLGGVHRVKVLLKVTLLTCRLLSVVDY